MVGGVSLYIAGPVAWSWLPDLTHRREYRLNALDIHFTDPPAWVPAGFLRDVIREGELPEELSLLNDRLVDDVAAAFQKDAWVEKVVSVRKDFAQGVTVVVEYRKPVAFVVTDSDRYPVDSKATLLPPPSLPRGERRTSHDSQRPLDAAGAGRHELGRPHRRGGRPPGRGARPVVEKTPARLDSNSRHGRRPRGGADEAIYELRTVGGSHIIWGRAPTATTRAN